jgi:hypothetical protein
MMRMTRFRKETLEKDGEGHYGKVVNARLRVVYNAAKDRFVIAVETKCGVQYAVFPAEAAAVNESALRSIAAGLTKNETEYEYVNLKSGDRLRVPQPSVVIEGEATKSGMVVLYHYEVLSLADTLAWFLEEEK